MRGPSLTVQTPSVDEPIFGLLPHLPGCGDIYDRTTGPRMRANCVDNPDVLEAVGYVGTPPSGSCSLSGGAAVLASASGFGWQGCLGYTDARPLTVNVAGGADSTTACLKACAAAGPQSCGVEFGGQARLLLLRKADVAVLRSRFEDRARPGRRNLHDALQGRSGPVLRRPQVTRLLRPRRVIASRQGL